MKLTNVKNNHTFYIGVMWSLISAFLWGTTFVCVRHLVSKKSIDPVSLSLSRFFIAGILLFLYGYLKGEKLFSLKFKDFLYLGMLSLFGVTGMSVLIFWGQETTTAINSSIINSLNPLMILILGLFIGEKITFPQITGILISLLGCLMVVNVITLSGFTYEANHLQGDLLVLSGAFCWALSAVLGKRTINRLGSFVVAVWSMLMGSFQLFVILVFMRGSLIIPDSFFSWILVLYIALFPTAIGFLAWFKAMEKINLSLLNVMQYLIPVFTIVMAWVLLDEKMTWFNAIGTVFVIGGIMLVMNIGKNEICGWTKNWVTYIKSKEL